MSKAPGPRIERIDVAAFTVPTDRPESDGTFAWDATTMVLVQAHAAGRTGLGYSYAAPAAARLIHDTLAVVVSGQPVFDLNAVWWAMQRSVRNIGRPGIGAHAISAVDTALWDLKARLLDVALVDLFGAARSGIMVYGSGGFTSYTDDELREQLGAWAGAGLRAVKMKIGREPEHDAERVRSARDAIGPAVELLVDANGAYNRKQALAFAELFTEFNVTWFEEPVSSDDLQGLSLLVDQAPAGMEIAAGEYAYTVDDLRRLLEARAVDVLQADATRCCGYSGFLQASALCSAFHLPLSTHTAPALHVHVACACEPVRHLEYFHDHVRLEAMLFDGVNEPVAGILYPDRTRAGNGLTLRERDAERYRVA